MPNTMTEETNPQTEVKPTPIKNLTGAAIAGALAVGLYFFTLNVAAKLATTHFQNPNALAAKLTILVRTLLLAMGVGATMIFGVISLGLILLTVKLAIGQVWGFLKRSS